MKKLKHGELSDLLKVTELLRRTAGWDSLSGSQATVRVPRLLSQLTLPTANEGHDAVIHMAREGNEEQSNEVHTQYIANSSVAELGQAPALGPQPDQTTLSPPPAVSPTSLAARSPERVRKKALLSLWSD